MISRRSSYVELARRLPRPSQSQVDAFVSYVGSAHSWYKHLPLFAPGECFVFFLNPNAGREWITTAEGGRYRDRQPDAPEHERFHYTWQPTTDYVQRFGYLDYWTPAGTSFLVPTGTGILDTGSSTRVQAPMGGWIELSDDVRTAGAVCLTASIHPIGRDPAIWLARLGKGEMPGWTPDTTLPREPPNDELLARIVELLRALLTTRRSMGWARSVAKTLHAWLGLAGQPAADPHEEMALLREYLERHAAAERVKIRTAVGAMLHRVFDQD